MLKILKYSFYDLMRSRWSYVYFLFYLILGFVLGEGAGIAPGLAHADRLRALARTEKNVLVRHRCVS